MNRHPLPSLAALVTVQGEWAHCRQCPDAFWGVANVTAVVRAKAERHAHKAHGAAGGRPARRVQAAAPAPAAVAVDVQALVDAAYKAAGSGILRRLGGGAFRNTYEVGRKVYALKLADSPASRECNLAEAESWRTAPEAVRKYLCPVIAVHPQGDWVLMQFAEQVGGVDWRDAEEAIAAIGNHFGDLHGGNFGYLNGVPVCTDYAAGRGHNGIARQGKPAAF